MRGLRSTIALLVVLVGLGAYIYFVTWKQDGEHRGVRREEGLPVGRVRRHRGADDQGRSGDRTTAQEGRRALADRRADPAGGLRVRRHRGSPPRSANLDVVRVIDENPADLDGVRPRRRRASRSSSRPAATSRPASCSSAPRRRPAATSTREERREARVPHRRVPERLAQQVDVRPARQVGDDSSTATRSTASTSTSAARRFGFAKKGEDWKVDQPLAATADSGTVEALVGRVQGAQMKSIVTEQATPADLKKFGLDKPDVAVTLNLGSARATLAVGGAAGDDAVYARDVSKHMVVTVEKALADDLKKPLDDYRRREAFEFRAFTANRVELTRAGQTVAFERVKGEGENAQDTWKRVSPNPGDVDKSEDRQLLAGLADIRATSFTTTTAKTGLDKPALTVYAKFDDDKKEERVTFGKSGSDVYFARPGEPGRGEGGGREVHRSDQGARRAVEMTCGCARLFRADPRRRRRLRRRPASFFDHSSQSFIRPATRPLAAGHHGPARRAGTQARELGHRGPIARGATKSSTRETPRSSCSPHPTSRSSRSPRPPSGSDGTSRSPPSCRCRGRSTAACSTAISSWPAAATRASTTGTAKPRTVPRLGA